MKKWMTLVTVGVLAMGLTTSVFAQAAGPKGGAPGQGQGQKQGAGALKDRAAAMQKVHQEILAKLNLSAQQKSQLEALQKKEKAAMEALREKAKAGDREALRAEMQKIRKDAQEGLKAILNEQQQQQYQELLKAAREKMGGATDRKGGLTDRAGKGGTAGKGGAAGKGGKAGKGGGGL